MSEPTLWWMSWKDRTENSPRRGIPVQGVIGWWVTGWAADSSYRCIVALVNAPTKRDAAQLLGTNWPSYDRPREWRFARKLKVEYLDADTTPRIRLLDLGDRFPFQKWGVERLRAIGTVVMNRAVTP